MENFEYLLDTPQIVGGIITIFFFGICIFFFIAYNKAIEKRKADARSAYKAELGRLKANMVNARGLQLVRESMEHLGTSLRGMGPAAGEAADAFDRLKNALSVIPAEVMPDEFIQEDEGFKYFCTDHDKIVYRQVRFAYIPTSEDDEH